MDVSGFKIYKSIEAWNKFVNKFEESGSYTEVYFGTNEYIEYDSIDDFLSKVTVTEISVEDAAVIIHNFPEAESYGYGLFPNM